MLPISSLLVGFRNIVLHHFSVGQSEKCLCEYFVVFGSFSNSSKVIVKGISNIIENSYSITIIMGERSRCTGSYSFKRDQGFDSFSCVFNVIPIYFKMFIIMSLFTFLHQSGKHFFVVFVFNVSFFFQYRVLHINELNK